MRRRRAIPIRFDYMSPVRSRIRQNFRISVARGRHIFSRSWTLTGRGLSLGCEMRQPRPTPMARRRAAFQHAARCTRYESAQSPFCALAFRHSALPVLPCPVLPCPALRLSPHFTIHYSRTYITALLLKLAIALPQAACTYLPARRSTTTDCESAAPHCTAPRIHRSSVPAISSRGTW
jgi:hypothetical protein